jgi:hypothetical protein
MPQKILNGGQIGICIQHLRCHRVTEMMAGDVALSIVSGKTSATSSTRRPHLIISMNLVTKGHNSGWLSIN